MQCCDWTDNIRSSSDNWPSALLMSLRKRKAFSDLMTDDKTGIIPISQGNVFCYVNKIWCDGKSNFNIFNCNSSHTWDQALHGIQTSQQEGWTIAVEWHISNLVRRWEKEETNSILKFLSLMLYLPTQIMQKVLKIGKFITIKIPVCFLFPAFYLLPFPLITIIINDTCHCYHLQYTYLPPDGNEGWQFISVWMMVNLYTFLKSIPVSNVFQPLIRILLPRSNWENWQHFGTSYNSSCICNYFHFPYCTQYSQVPPCFRFLGSRRRASMN